MSIFLFDFCTFSINPWLRSALKMESVQNFPNQGPICCPKHTHWREEVIVKFLVCDVVVVQVSFFLSFLLVVVVILCWFSTKVFADISPLNV